MDRLSTIFAGLSLRNPIIVCSSGLTDTAAKCLALEEAGADALELNIMEVQTEMDYKYGDYERTQFMKYFSGHSPRMRP